jgi:hypothetical protein
MPDRNRNRHGGTPEFELAYYTKELGKPMQRQLLRKQLALLGEGANAAARHGEDLVPEHEGPPPQEDRAG